MTGLKKTSKNYNHNNLSKKKYIKRIKKVESIISKTTKFMFTLLKCLLTKKSG